MTSLKNFPIENVQIVCDSFSYEKNMELRSFIGSPMIRKIMELVGESFIMILGGDGTMLRAVQEYHEQGLPFLGINFGTKGFLLNDRSCLDKISQFKQKEYPLLSTQVRVDGQIIEHVAFNEVQVKASSGSMIDLHLCISDHSGVDIKGDGVLVSTPAGSTAYNRSAGGPVLQHESNEFVITPLLAFEPKGIRSIPILNTDWVSVKNNTDRDRELSVFADTTPLIKDTILPVEVRIARYNRNVRLLIADSYEDTWRAKIFEEQGMRRL